MRNAVRRFKQAAYLFFGFSLVFLLLITPQGSSRLLVPVDDPTLVRTLWEDTRRNDVQKGTAHPKNSQDEVLLWRAQGPLEADDPHLIRLLKERYLDPPSTGPLNLTLDQTGTFADAYNSYRTAFASWVRINSLLKKLFKGVSPGFFVEAGALDGEFISNTLFLERELGWTGLLVEADPSLYAALPGKQRRTWSSNTCLSTNSYAHTATFHTYKPNEGSSIANKLLGRSTGNMEGVKAPAAGQMGRNVPVRVQCFPLYSYLLALKATTVQYVSLDVEGAEADILLNLPWENINVTVWTIEHRAQNTRFKEYYEEPMGVKPPKLPDEDAEGKETRKDNSLPAVEKKVVYITQHDPAQGQDEYLIQFMEERGYFYYDYWDGDYTFIDKNSHLCRKYCKDSPVLAVNSNRGSMSLV